MAYKTYTTQMLADFSGRPVDSYGNATTGYAATSAIPQALLLFKIGTCLASPDDLTDDQKQLVDFAIESMADAIVLGQDHQAAVASPFSSETIGSYSYSKTAKAVAAGLPTGIMWFDLAVNELSVCDRDDDVPMFGGIEMFEHDGVIVAGSIGGNRRFLSPAEIEYSTHWGYDPSALLTSTGFYD